MEIPHKSGIQYLTPGYPAPLLRTVTLPVNERLNASTPAAGVENPTNREGRMVINHPRGWRCRFDPGNMERRVHPDEAGQLEVDNNRSRMEQERGDD
ncbi:Hypothetical protein SMAX5B_019222 [Scophthalmus maximus]|uniref:Uncharacterized protein n=1 Tax=Scophthalmus maximus TaxID=52904 RepID=A0A2U9C9S4_SCOMX|nr:Hypothetical protein SMAX5B_019222 [Scophthalmus maximus]